MHSFELFGYDFMIDEAFKVYLIEANINPCLNVTSSFSSHFIANLLDNTFKVALDPLFNSGEFGSKKSSGETVPEIKYELIFDQVTDGTELEELYSNINTSTLNLIIGELNDELPTEAIMEED